MSSGARASMRRSARIFLRLRPRGPGRPGDGGFELVDVHGLDQVLAEARLAAAAQVLLHAEAADGDPLEAVTLAQLTHQVEAAAVRQPEVAHHEVEGVARGQLPGR